MASLPVGGAPARDHPTACSALSLDLDVATLSNEATKEHTAEAAYRAGIAWLYKGDGQRGVVWLGRAVERSPDWAEAWSALAAAHLVVAAVDGGPDNAVRALDAAAGALSIQPLLGEASENLRRAESQLAVIDAGEAYREDLVRVMGEQRDVLTLLPEDRDLLAEVIERHHLPAWADALLSGDSSGAKAFEGLATVGALFVESKGGDNSISSLLRELFAVGAHHEPRPARARAWLAYVTALRAFEGDDVQGAIRSIAPHRASLLTMGPATAGRTRLLLAVIDRVRGDVREASRQVRPATPVFDGFPVLDARRRWQRGLLLAESGKLGDAQIEYRLAQEMFRRAGEREGEAMVSSLLASGYADLQDWSRTWTEQVRANRLLRFCRRLRRESIRTNAGLASSAMGLYRSASAMRRPALEAARAMASSSAAGFLLTDEALDRHRAGDSTTALRLLDEASSAVELIADYGTRKMLEALHLTARATVLADSSPEESQRLFGQALGLYRERGSEFGTPELLLQRGLLLRRLSKTREAEASFRDGLETTQRQIRSLSSVAARGELMAARWDLFTALAVALIEQGQPWSAFDVVEEARHEALRAQDAKIIAGAPPAKRPNTGTIWISYLDLGDRLQAWARLDQEQHTFSVDYPNAAIGETIGQLRDSLRRSDWHSLAAMQLFDSLLAPVRTRLASARLVVVCADGLLSTIPFGALLDRSSNRLVFEMAPVVVSHSCRPAIGSVHRLESTPRRIVVVGDPERSDASERWRRLAETRPEAKAVSEMYSEATLVLGSDATPATIRKLLPEAEVFHFAGHAVGHQTRSGLSRLILASSQLDPEGALYASEIETLKVSARVVVLAACDTAVGVPRHGAGVMGLTRAFLNAGAESVLATQWPVEDASASAFFVELHSRLAKGFSPATALQSTQRWAKMRGMGSEMWASVVAVTQNGETMFRN